VLVAQERRASSARSTSTTFVLTTICVSKSTPAPSSRYSCVGRAKQYLQACRQPRVGLMVHRNGICDAAGTLLSALRHSTSWNVTPANSGVRTVRTSPASGSPGRVPSSRSAVSRWPSHLMAPVEHVFD